MDIHTHTHKNTYRDDGKYQESNSGNKYFCCRKENVDLVYALH